MSYQLINAEGERLAEALDAVVYDEREQGWRVGGVLYCDPGRAFSVAPRVPLEIDPRQLRQALTRLGSLDGVSYRDAVEAAVAAGDRDLKDWWEFSPTYRRDHHQVVAMAGILGATEAQVDAIWVLGATL